MTEPLMSSFRTTWERFLAPGGRHELVDVDTPHGAVEVYRSAPTDMRAVWRRAAADFADRPYLVYEDEHLSYGEVAARVRSLAVFLREEHAVGRGDRVAVAMRNYPEWTIAYWACVEIGATVVGLNGWWTGPELAYGLEDSKPLVLIADQTRIERLLPHLDDVRSARPLQIVATRWVGELSADSVRWEMAADPDRAPADLPAPRIDPDDDVSIFYTSGTTGRPKGARLTHRASVTNLFNLVFMTEVTAVAASGGDESVLAAGAMAERPGLVTMAATPLFHVTACNCVLHLSTLNGGSIVFLHRWDPGRALELIEREHVDVFAGVPTMSRELVGHPDWTTRDTSSLVGMGGGGAAMQPDLVAKIDGALPTGQPTTGYGLTETTGIVTANYGPTCLLKPTSCGPIVPTLEARLVDDGGAVLERSPEAIGRLEVRGAVVFAGYLNRPDATSEVIREGWLDTGDVVRIDEDGFVHIVDRAKDIVNRGGENVSCTEVEAAIYELSGVAEAAVFGLPDVRLGECVAAVVVREPGAELGEGDVSEHLTARLAAYKVPATIQVRDEPLPRNANGKFLKRELRDSYV